MHGHKLINDEIRLDMSIYKDIIFFTEKLICLKKNHLSITN